MKYLLHSYWDDVFSDDPSHGWFKEFPHKVRVDPCWPMLTATCWCPHISYQYEYQFKSIKIINQYKPTWITCSSKGIKWCIIFGVFLDVTTHVTSSASFPLGFSPPETPAEVSNLDYDDYVGSGSPGIPRRFQRSGDVFFEQKWYVKYTWNTHYYTHYYTMYSMYTIYTIFTYTLLSTILGFTLASWSMFQVDYGLIQSVRAAGNYRKLLKQGASEKNRSTTMQRFLCGWGWCLEASSPPKGPV